MNVIEWVGEHVSHADDSETFHAQKILGFGMSIAGTIFTLITIVIHYVVGFNGAALAFLVLALILPLSGLFVLWRPALYTPVVVVTAACTILVNAAAQALTGGLTSGTYVIVWALTGIVAAVLLNGWRSAIPMLLLFSLSIVALALLNPYVQSLALQAPVWSRLAIGIYCLVFMGVYIAGSILLLIRVIETLHLRAEDLLLNILPASVAARLKENPATIADGFSEVTVLFADIVDFTSMSSGADPVEVVNLLNDIFSEFDELAEKYGLEKIKTIGDAYMVAAGLPEPRPDHTEAIVAFAIDMLSAVEQYEGFQGEPVRLRVGINTGPVVAGVIGRQKFIYDLWGDAVNVASRMESNGLANEIQVTEAVKERVEGQYTFTEREPMEIKGKGMMVTYLLESEE